MYAAAQMLAVRRAGAAAARLRAIGAAEAEIARARAELRVAGLDAAAGAAPGKPAGEMRASDTPRAAPLAEIAATTARRENVTVAVGGSVVAARAWLRRAQGWLANLVAANTMFNEPRPPSDDALAALLARDGPAMEDQYAAIARENLPPDLQDSLAEEHARFVAETPLIHASIDKLVAWRDAERLYADMRNAARGVIEEGKRQNPEHGFYIREYFARKVGGELERYEELLEEVKTTIDTDGRSEADRDAVWEKVRDKLEALATKVNDVLKEFDDPEPPEIGEEALKNYVNAVRSTTITTPGPVLKNTDPKLTGFLVNTNLRGRSMTGYRVMCAYIRPDLYFETTDGAADIIRALCTSTVGQTNVFALTELNFVILFLAAMPYVLREPDAWARIREFGGTDPVEVRRELTEILLLHWDPVQSHYTDMSWMPAANGAITSSGILDAIHASDTLDEAIAKIYTFPV